MSETWFDDAARSLAGATSRREALRGIGVLLGAGVLSVLGASRAWGGPKTKKSYCGSLCDQCPTVEERRACRDACQNCRDQGLTPCGSCSGGWTCKDLSTDVHNCGACGNDCTTLGYDAPACCDGYCTDLLWDPQNCTACGNDCGYRYNEYGQQVANGCCDGVCTELGTDTNCAWCGDDCTAQGLVCIWERIGGHYCA